MASRAVEELVTGIWCWEKHPRGLRPDEFGGRTSYAVVAENDLLLVDPLVDGADDPVVETLDDLVCGSIADPHHDAVPHPECRMAVATLPQRQGAHLRPSSCGDTAR